MGAQDSVNYIVGTIYCKSALKPSIIDQVQEKVNSFIIKAVYSIFLSFL
jgi:hypothetical protein